MASRGRVIRLLVRDEDPRSAAFGATTQHGWSYDGITPESDRDNTEWVWQVDNENSFHYIEYRPAQMAYVAAVGRNPEAVVAQIQTGMELWSLDELLAAWDDVDAITEEDDIDRANKVDSALVLGLAASSESDPRVIIRLSKWLSHPDALVRRAVIMAMGFAEWPEFVPILEQHTKAEPDEALRDLALKTVNAHEIVNRQLNS